MGLRSFEALQIRDEDGGRRWPLPRLLVALSLPPVAFKGNFIISSPPKWHLGLVSDLCLLLLWTNSYFYHSSCSLWQNNLALNQPFIFILLLLLLHFLPPLLSSRWMLWFQMEVTECFGLDWMSVCFGPEATSCWSGSISVPSQPCEKNTIAYIMVSEVDLRQEDSLLNWRRKRPGPRKHL